VFLAGTTRDVQPVHRVDERDLGAAGPLTQQVVETFARRAVENEDP